MPTFGGERMATLQIQSAEIAAPTSTAAAVDVSRATQVRVVNSGSTARLVTIVTAPSGDVLGSTTIPGYETLVIRKGSAECMFAANAEIKLSRVGVVG